jgi:SAM-dependent methyltransferase
MMAALHRTKRILRENPHTRRLYRVLAERWLRSRIYMSQHLFGRYHTASRFDRLFASLSDPWGYRGDPVSEERRELILSTLPRERYARLLEIGCAAGWMTLPLANRTDELVAADISSVALDRARQHCRQVTNVKFIKLDLLADPIMESFECILCAGLLVFLSASAQPEIRDRLVAALTTGGDLVLEHTRQAYPGEIAGSEIHALYRRHPALRTISHREVGNYAITLFRKVEG